MRNLITTDQCQVEQNMSWLDFNNQNYSSKRHLPGCQGDKHGNLHQKIPGPEINEVWENSEIMNVGTYLITTTQKLD